MKYTIWTNKNLNLNDWNDFFIENYPESNFSDDEKLDIINDMNNDYFDDEKANLDQFIDGDIIVIANLGLWNGRKSGYTILENNLNSIFDVCEDYNDFYVDNYDVKAECAHHDGTNYYTFRELKPYENHDNFLAKIYNGTVTQKDITRHTKSLKKYIKSIYGF